MEKLDLKLQHENRSHISIHPGSERVAPCSAKYPCLRCRISYQPDISGQAGSRVLSTQAGEGLKWQR